MRHLVSTFRLLALCAAVGACTGEVSTPPPTGGSDPNENQNGSNSNGNVNQNGNDNTGNDNTNGNTNDNGNANGNDNTSDPTCTDGTQNGLETGQDCGGPECAPCATGGCALPSDCDSGVCTDGTCQAATCDDGVQNGGELGIDCGGDCLALSPAQRCELDEGCTVDTDCSSGACQDEVCREASCANGSQDGFETGLDCGGRDCAPCDATGGCVNASDCVSGVCDAGTCAEDSCTDGVQNGDETGVDCGGATCDGCPDLAGCATDADCASGTCLDETCRAASCTDATQNGDETAVDCGGSCPACDDGLACDGPSDCTSGVCSTTCQAPSCTDGAQNGDETAVDCGGLSCDACTAGQGCANGYDCDSGVCRADGTCGAPSCSDRVQNGNETDVDCGGSCGPCVNDETCENDSDCQSNICTSGTCSAPSCDDGRLNGDETAVDCGGSCASLDPAQTCANGEACVSGTDCSSTLCVGGECVAAGCTNEAQDGDETDVDCGGPDCGPCGDALACVDPQDCVSGVCEAGFCQVATCDDGIQNQDEFGIDCGGNCAVGCLDGSACLVPSDCASGVCTTERCQAPTCTDGVTNGDEEGPDCGGSCPEACPDTCANGVQDREETDIDCGGSLCSPCTNGNSCLEASDCTSSLCSAGFCLGACPDPLVNCDGECVDVDSDARFCGSCTNACAEGQACLDSACTTPIGGIGPAPAKCADGGPPIFTGEGGATDCSGNLAGTTFRWGICTCDDYDLNQPVFVDGFDSRVSPYRGRCSGGANDGAPCSTVNDCGGNFCVDGIGAGLGTNGFYSNNQQTAVWGTLWAADVGQGSNTGNNGEAISTPLVCQQNVYAGNAWNGSSAEVAGDAFIEGDVLVSGTLGGDLTYGGAVQNMSVSGEVLTSPIDPGPACDCSADQYIDVMSIVERHACTLNGQSWNCPAYDPGQTVRGNDNALIGLAPDLFDNAGGYLELDCGYYYFNRIGGSGVGPITIKVNGNVAIFVGAEMDSNAQLAFVLGPNANLDVFVAHEVCAGNFNFGSVLRPANARLYVGGGLTPAAYAAGDPAPQNCGTRLNAVVRMPKNLNIAGNVYSVSGPIDLSQDTLLYGSIFGREYNTSQSTTVHYDTAVVRAGDVCAVCGDGVIDAPAEQCDGVTLGGTTCASLGFDGGTLGCSATCLFDPADCSSCGDGIRNGNEQCDGADFGDPAATCISEGFASGDISCNADCTLNVDSCVEVAGCGNNALDDGEECDFVDTAAQFATSFDNCDDFGFYTDGSVSCDPLTCTVSTDACPFCGDGIVNGSEACDGSDLNGESCSNLTSVDGTLRCNADCSFDTGGCGQCTDCTDCNNQACVGGSCGACTTDADCCAPLVCFGGTCVLF